MRLDSNGEAYWQIGDIDECIIATRCFGDGTAEAWQAKLDEGFTHYAQGPDGDTEYFRSEDDAARFQAESV